MEPKHKLSQHRLDLRADGHTSCGAPGRSSDCVRLGAPPPVAAHVAGVGVVLLGIHCVLLMGDLLHRWDSLQGWCIDPLRDCGLHRRARDSRGESGASAACCCGGPCALWVAFPMVCTCGTCPYFSRFTAIATPYRRPFRFSSDSASRPYALPLPGASSKRPFSAERLSCGSKKSCASPEGSHQPAPTKAPPWFRPSGRQTPVWNNHSPAIGRDDNGRRQPSRDACWRPGICRRCGLGRVWIVKGRGSAGGSEASPRPVCVGRKHEGPCRAARDLDEDDVRPDAVEHYVCAS